MVTYPQFAARLAKCGAAEHPSSYRQVGFVTEHSMLSSVGQDTVCRTPCGIPCAISTPFSVDGIQPDS